MTRQRTPPWFCMPCSAWELAIEHLPRPLDREYAIADLRWLHDQLLRGRPHPTTGRPLTRMPGRDWLADRWGWRCKDRVHTVNAVRQLLAETHLWHRPNKRGSQAADQEGASDPPGKHQRSARKVPSADRSNADNARKSTRKAPAKHQESTREVPGQDRDRAANGDNAATHRSRDPEIQIDLATATDAAERLYLSILLDHASDTTTPHQWTVPPDTEALRWYRDLVANEVYQRIDLYDQLLRWRDWLESGRQGRVKYPTIWQNSLRNWLRRSVEYQQRQEQEKRTNDQRQRGTRSRPGRRRGQTDRGSGTSFDGVKYADAGAE